MGNYTLYKHVTPSGKVYVGITNQKPEYRWNNGKGYMNIKDGPFKRSIFKYGWDNIQHIILVEHLSEVQAKQWEIRLISHYKQLGISLNITNGGDGTCGCQAWNKGTIGIVKGYWKNKKMSEEHKLRLRYSHLGKTFTKKQHVIYVYNYRGEYLYTFNDIDTCCKSLGVGNTNLYKVLSGIRKHVGGYQFRDLTTINIPLKYLDKENFRETYPIIAINKTTKQTIYMDSVFDLPRMLNRKIKMVLDTIKRQGSYLGWYFIRVNFKQMTD